MDKKTKTKKLQTNIPEPLMARITARSEELWGENDSASNVVATALRDWLSQNESGEIDYNEYERIGFPLVREPNRYSMEDPEMKKFVEACWANDAAIHTPLLIYYCGQKLVVLDGLARFTAVVAAWKSGVSIIKRVPFQRFVGEEHLA